MTQSAPSPYGSSSSSVDGYALPTLGTVPLGPDEPELFTNAMERILDHLGSDEFGAGR